MTPFRWSDSWPDYEVTLRRLERQDRIDRRVARLKRAFDVFLILCGIVALVGINSCGNPDPANPTPRHETLAELSRDASGPPATPLHNLAILAAVLIGCAASEPFHRWLYRREVTRNAKRIEACRSSVVLAPSQHGRLMAKAGVVGKGGPGYSRTFDSRSGER